MWRRQNLSLLRFYFTGIGEEALEVYNTFKFIDKDGEFHPTTENAARRHNFTIYYNYCEPRKNVLFERFKFWKRSQQESETIDMFVTDLKKIITNILVNYIKPTTNYPVTQIILHQLMLIFRRLHKPKLFSDFGHDFRLLSNPIDCQTSNQSREAKTI
ncbi:Uncharacterised protein at_DN2202 [Pycnogonum litorale]